MKKISDVIQPNDKQSNEMEDQKQMKFVSHFSYFVALHLMDDVKVQSEIK